MAGETLNLVIRHVILMKEFGGIFGCQYLAFIVALEARKLRYVSVARHHRGVTPLAFDAPRDVALVVEDKVRTYLDVAPRFEVAGAAARYILFLIFSLVEMADKALNVGHDHMGALNNLGVTGRTTKLLLSAHLLDVLGMVKNNVLENNRVLKVLSFVAPALQTAYVIDLGMRFGRTLAGNKVGEGELSISPFSLKMVGEAGFVMTFNAGDVPVGGGLP